MEAHGSFSPIRLRYFAFIIYMGIEKCLSTKHKKRELAFDKLSSTRERYSTPCSTPSLAEDKLNLLLLSSYVSYVSVGIGADVKITISLNVLSIGLHGTGGIDQYVASIRGDISTIY